MLEVYQKFRYEAKPVCRMRLKAVALSLYDLSCWWEVKHKHTDNKLKIPESQICCKVRCLIIN